jgi:Raf kinase inhibitor-like YbhB/YbcL family protein
MSPRRQPFGARALAGALAAVLVGVLVAACGSSGRELRDPPPGQTAPPRKPAAAGTLSSSTTVASTLATFGMASDAWRPGGDLPERFTCDGEDVSPPLQIFTVPPDAVELAIVVTDVDAGDFAHWVLAGLAPSTASIGEGEVPAGAVQARNSFGRESYSGPCPPEGELHQYEFAVYAMDEPSGVEPGQDPQSAIALVTRAPLELATVTATYRR